VRLFAMLLCVALLPLLSAAKCHPAGSRVIVFVQGYYTYLDADGTGGSLVEEHRFETLKQGFRENGYKDAALLDYSYNGGTVTSSGQWRPEPYHCADTDRHIADSVARLEQMLRDYRAHHPDAHFTLVGHSLGGYIAWEATAAELGRPEDQRLDIDQVVTLDAPLYGASADKKTILDLVPCDKTYEAGAKLVAARLDTFTHRLRHYQISQMKVEGIRVATLGNLNDCLWATAKCIGGDWVDDSDTQFNGEADLSKGYEIQSDLLASHEAILAHPPAVADVVAFVGAP
jgi:hypothetical protein